MKPLMIEGLTEATGTMEVHAPYDRSLIETVATSDWEQVDHALAVAYHLFRDRSEWLTLERRVQILDALVELMKAEKDSLAIAAAREGGKPLADSIVEVNRAIDGVKLCIEHVRSEHGDVIPMNLANRVAFTQKEPVGVVVAVSAFNHPLNLIVHQVAAAVAAGCPSIVKPAEDTPLSCIRFVELLIEAGLPKAWCQMVMPVDIEVSEKLVTDPRVGFFSFIGSARVGWMLRSKLSPGTRCALEHGGAAPVILTEDYDQELALNSLLKGGFYHAGQVCVSVQRVYVPTNLLDSFANALSARAANLVIGDPTHEDTEVGPLIRPHEVSRVHDWVQEAVEAGAQLLCGGKPRSETCYEVTVLVEPPKDAKVSQLEIFGPVVCLYGYDDLDEAIAEANGLSVAFQAAVFTNDINTAMAVYKSIDASAVMVNDHTAFRVDGMPFAGLRESGLGVGGIPHTINDMQIEKMMVIQSKNL